VAPSRPALRVGSGAPFPRILLRRERDYTPTLEGGTFTIEIAEEDLLLLLLRVVIQFLLSLSVALAPVRAVFPPSGLLQRVGKLLALVQVGQPEGGNAREVSCCELTPS
jgi:hypothetical protein